MLGSTHASQCGIQNFVDGEPLTPVELRAESYLDPAYVLGRVVQNQFMADPFECLGILHDGECEVEALQIFLETRPFWNEHVRRELIRPSHREVDPALHGELEHGGGTE